MQALKNCVEIGLKSGIRVTAHKSNYKEIPQLIEMALELGVPRFCLYWLVPSGRGMEGYLENQLSEEEIEETLDYLYTKAKELDPEVIEILTVDAPQDGVYLLNRMKEENHPEYKNAYKLLSMTGDSCSAGDRVANVDPVGNVYPCQFSQRSDFCIGNIRETKFSEMWNDPENDILNRFRAKKQNLKGICNTCSNMDTCGGGCRIRSLNQHGDIWAEDSFCVFDDLDELDKSSSGE
jgi:radical SAM protein with 4Fe4S-binding SPASM domain